MKSTSVKVWYQIHQWTGLICTLFLLVLCLTGLPLIFHDELHQWLRDGVSAPALPGHSAPIDLDRLVETGKQLHPKEAIQFLVWSDDSPHLVSLSLADSVQAPPGHSRPLYLDDRTGKVLKDKVDNGPVKWLFKLHTEMFAGPGGKVFLGVMALLFLAALFSGAVLYAPFLGHKRFGTFRKEYGPRIKWYDLHNLIGIILFLWMAVVAGTGAINAFSDLFLKVWRADQFAAMIAPYRGKPVPRTVGSVQKAVEVARAAAPGMAPRFVAFPGCFLSSPHHYTVYLAGDTPLTSRLVKPVLVDAETLQFTDSRDLPWYMAIFLLSQPLHFGDYGGAPLKILWAFFDVGMIAVLVSGIYLWVNRRRQSFEKMLDEFSREEGVIP